MEQASAAVSGFVDFLTCEHALHAADCLRRAVKLTFNKDDAGGSWAAALLLWGTFTWGWGAPC